MGTWNRIWIFFVIVAVGLVLSWGQVGKKTQQKLASDTSELLGTEHDCRPLTAPCAATGVAIGVVLGPGGSGWLELASTSPATEIDVVAKTTRAGRERTVKLGVEQLSLKRWRIALPANLRRESGELRIWMTPPNVSAVFPISNTGT